MDERSLALLRRKLEALHYTEPLDAGSAPLVSRVVDDLVRTSDAYRATKLQCAKQAQEASMYSTKVGSPTWGSQACDPCLMFDHRIERHAAWDAKPLPSKAACQAPSHQSTHPPSDRHPAAAPRAPLLPAALSQLDVVRQEAGRLQAENNDLHVQLIAEAEKFAALQKDAYAKTKGLEDKVRGPGCTRKTGAGGAGARGLVVGAATTPHQPAAGFAQLLATQQTAAQPANARAARHTAAQVSELGLWKHQAMGRLESMEKDNAGAGLLLRLGHGS